MKHVFGSWGWGGTGGKMYGQAICARCGESFNVTMYEGCSGKWTNEFAQQPESWKRKVAKESTSSRE